MTLATGDRLGPYAIQSALGAGAMGEVYRAQDTRLDRTVAIKVLPRDLAGSPARRQRLEREARAISRLSHPNICALYDIGEENGVQFLVMEYLEGETLAQRLTRGALPLKDALRYAIEIADALAHAHRDGIVHRDLKPANIMLARSGAKLLDFGIAKALRPPERALFVRPDGSTAAAESNTPTRMQTLTEEGTILGTIHYMAPEQLEAKETDARADIFSFGAVVYEMVSGRLAFEGTSQASVIAAVLEHDPAPLAARRHPSGATTVEPVPPLLEHAITRCLAKDPDERWQTAADLKRELEWIARNESAAHAAGPATSRAVDEFQRSRDQRRILLAAIAVLLAATLTLAAVVYFRGEPEVRGPDHFSLDLPEGTAWPSGNAGPNVAVSPDGHTLAFAAGESLDRVALWTQSLESLATKKLAGTEAARYPFWSPDSRSIGFFAQGKLKTIRLSGEPPRTLADAGEADGGAWGTQDIIVFAQVGTGLSRVSAAGGPATTLTTLDTTRQDRMHGWPSFLPDGRRFVFLIRCERNDHGGIYVGSVDSSEHTRLLASDLRAAYAPPGYLLFGRETTLMAQPFDRAHVRLTGDAVAVQTELASNKSNGRIAFSVSDAGVLVYRPARAGLANPVEVRWFDRAGKPLETLGPPGTYGGLSMSPDDRTLAVMQTRSQEIWLLDVARGTPQQLRVGAGLGRYNPVWSPDGKWLAYSVEPKAGDAAMYAKPTSGSGRDMPLATSNDTSYPLSWSPDNRFILYGVVDPKTGWDVWVLPLAGDRKPMPYLDTPANEVRAEFSPDGRWVAYSSNESGTNQVYVQSFPKSGANWRVSTDGGSQPLWRRDGRELFYLDPGNNLMAVDVKAGTTVDAGVPRALFKTALRSSLVVNSGNQYAASGDGQRFLVTVQNEPPPIAVVLNWMTALKK